MDENARVFIEIRHVGASDKPIKSLVFTNYVLVDEGMTKNAIFPRTTIRVTNQQIRDVLAVVRTHWVSKNSAKGDFGTFKFLVSIDGSLDSFLADRSRSKEILTGISRCLESLENAVTAINRVHKRLGDED